MQDEFRLSTLDAWRLLVRTVFSAVESCGASLGHMEVLKEVYQQHRFLFQELAKGGMEAEEMLLEALRLDLPKVDPAHPGPFVHLAHAMYDEDVLSEEAFLEWERRKGVQQSPLHAALVPFLQWLKLCVSFSVFLFVVLLHSFIPCAERRKRKATRISWCTSWL